MGILGLTSKNALICPAVTQILEKIEQIYNWPIFDLKFTSKFDNFVTQ
jgi:hypothetical protein